MSNIPIMFQPLMKYVEFNGRSRRTEFWLWVLFRWLVGMVCGSIVAGTLFAGIDWQHLNQETFPATFMSRYFTVMPLFQLVNLGLLLPTLAVTVRRLHDIGRTGWWVIMPMVVAMVTVMLAMIFVGTQIFAMAGHTDNMSDAEGAAFAFKMLGAVCLCFIPIVIAEIVMLVFYVTEGERKTNRFGPDPKGAALNDTP